MREMNGLPTPNGISRMEQDICSGDEGHGAVRHPTELPHSLGTVSRASSPALIDKAKRTCVRSGIGASRVLIVSNKEREFREKTVVALSENWNIF